MEKKKIKLEELKVQSFITEFEKESGKTLEVQGGDVIRQTSPLICFITYGLVCISPLCAPITVLRPATCNG